MAVKGESTMKTTLDRSAIERLLRGTSATAARKGAEKTKARVQANIRASGRVRTGKMHDSIEVVLVEEGRVTTYAVRSTLDYTYYQEEGIGPVVARPGKVLRFQPKGSAVFIFRPRTKGFAGAHFFRNAMREMKLSDFL